MNMTKHLLFNAIILLLLNSCGNTNYGTRQPSKNTYPKTSNQGTKVNSTSTTEQEYQALLKTYKPETADVLNDLLNSSSDQLKTSISVENKSRCNMVLTIKGNNYLKKIPIGTNKVGYAMVHKNQNYTLSGMVCNSLYQKITFITNSYSIMLSN